MQHAANVRLIYPEFKMNLFAECRKSSWRSDCEEFGEHFEN
jgi:hypothetical protein